MDKIYSNLVVGCLLLLASVHANSLLKPINQNNFIGRNLMTWTELYTETVDCGSVSQMDVFRRARLWLVQAVGSESLVLTDSQTGDLVGRVKQIVTIPRSEASTGGVYKFRCTVVIECANRKYRATITRIDLEDNTTLQPVFLETYRQKSPEVYNELDKQMKGLLASLQQDVKGYKQF